MKATLSEMSKEERALLLYFETCSVEYGGTVESRCMNEADFEVAGKWHASGFVDFGRITMKDCEYSRKHGRAFTHWVSLSPEAWDLAHQERKARFSRLYEKRWWTTTEEKRAAPVEA